MNVADTYIGPFQLREHPIATACINQHRGVGGTHHKTGVITFCYKCIACAKHDNLRLILFHIANIILFG
jgi:hypothetical protein